MMSLDKKLVAIGAVGVVAVILVLAGVSRVRSKKPKNSGVESSVTETSVTETQADRETVAGDGFNTNELDTGVRKEEKSNAGLGMGAYSETRASEEGSDAPETLAETDADGKNLTEPATSVPTIARDLSESEYGDAVKKEMEQNNAAITDTSASGSVGKDVDDAIREIQAAERAEAESRFNDPEFQRSYESFHAND